MRNELKCEIIQDLLPSYVDGLTSDVTNEVISEHVKSCKDCRCMLERMQEPEQPQIDAAQKEEIDFLKKARNQARCKIGITILLAAVFLAAVLFVKFYIIGSKLYAESVACRAEVSGKSLTVSGVATDSGLGISKIEYEEENGVVTVSFQATLVSPFHKGDFQSEYRAKKEITQVKLGERIIWDHGESVSANVSAVYRAKHAYIGDMSANGESAVALGMTKTLGNYKSELQTSKEPFGWKIILEDGISKKNQDILEQQMKSYAYVLLATIDNLGYVTYEYAVEAEDLSLTVSTEEADEFAGRDIKTCADTAAALQDLMEKAGLNKYGISNTQTSEKAIELNIVQSTDAKIYGMTIHYYIDGELCGDQGTINADGSSFFKNEVINFEFSSEDFVQKLQGASEIKFELEINDKDGKVYKVSSPVRVIAASGYSYQYVLSGNTKDGFVLSQ